jgi:hypothetical protein
MVQQEQVLWPERHSLPAKAFGLDHARLVALIEVSFLNPANIPGKSVGKEYV